MPPEKKAAVFNCSDKNNSDLFCELFLVSEETFALNADSTTLAAIIKKMNNLSYIHQPCQHYPGCFISPAGMLRLKWCCRLIIKQTFYFLWKWAITAQSFVYILYKELDFIFPQGPLFPVSVVLLELSFCFPHPVFLMGDFQLQIDDSKTKVDSCVIS